MRLAGADLSTLTPREESFLLARVDSLNTLEYLKTCVMLEAVLEAAAPGDGKLKRTNAALKKYRAALFPDIEQEEDRTTESTREILAKEHERGPMKVQALDYGKRKRKRR